jgi:hypothetical protein
MVSIVEKFLPTGSSGWFFLLKFRVQFFNAPGTDTVAEFGLRMLGDIGFHLFPGPFVIPDFLAVGADGNDSLKGLDGFQSIQQSSVGFFQFPFLLQAVFINGEEKIKNLNAIGIDEMLFPRKKNLDGHLAAKIFSNAAVHHHILHLGEQQFFLVGFGDEIIRAALQSL